MIQKCFDNLKEDSTNITNPIQMSRWFDYLSQQYTEQNKDIELKDFELSTNCPLDYFFNYKEIRHAIYKF